MAWWERVRGRGPRKAARSKKKRKKDRCDACDACEVCDVFDCLTLMTLSVCLRAFVGIFRASAVDPHTAPAASAPGRLAARAVRSYQLNVSARRPSPVCNLSPSCSRYALQAISDAGLLRGGVRIVRRLCACRAAACTG